MTEWVEVPEDVQRICWLHSDPSIIAGEAPIQEFPG